MIEKMLVGGVLLIGAGWFITMTGADLAGMGVCAVGIVIVIYTALIIQKCEGLPDE